MANAKKLSRAELLAVVAHLQSVLGRISAAANDRNPNRAADIRVLTEHGQHVCVVARAGDPPLGRLTHKLGENAGNAGAKAMTAELDPTALEKAYQAADAEENKHSGGRHPHWTTIEAAVAAYKEAEAAALPGLAAELIEAADALRAKQISNGALASGVESKAEYDYLKDQANEWSEIEYLLREAATKLAMEKPGWVPVRAESLLALRDQLVRADLNEAWHILYGIASPGFDKTEPWAALEAAAAAAPFITEPEVKP